MDGTRTEDRAGVEDRARAERDLEAAHGVVPAAPPQDQLAHAEAGRERALRADARRNRERILAAARAAFAEDGAEVQMDLIARRAQVGIGTLYRNFPTKLALISEMSRQWVTDGADRVARALENPDPWAAVVETVRGGAAAMARDIGLRNTFGELVAGHVCPQESARLRAGMAALVDRAHAAGAIRADITVDDVQALMCGLSAAIARGGEWSRYADIILAGLRLTAVPNPAGADPADPNPAIPVPADRDPVKAGA